MCAHRTRSVARVNLLEVVIGNKDRQARKQPVEFLTMSSGGVGLFRRSPNEELSVSHTRYA